MQFSSDSINSLHYVSTIIIPHSLGEKTGTTWDYF